MPCCDWGLMGAFGPENQFELFLNCSLDFALCSGAVLATPFWTA